MTMMTAGETGSSPASIADLLAERYSCRSYRPDPVPRAVIEQIVATARMTPSWCNTQPWNIVIASGAATTRLVDALYAHAAGPDTALDPDFDFPACYRGICDVRRKEVGAQPYTSVGIERDDAGLRQ